MRHPNKLIIVSEMPSGKTKVKINDYSFLYEQSLEQNRLIKKYIVKVLLINITEFDPSIVEEGDKIVLVISARVRRKNLKKFDSIKFDCMMGQDGEITREQLEEIVHHKMIPRIAYDF